MTFEKLMKDLTDSMKQQNRVKKAVIADIVTCTKNIAIEKKCKDNITEDIVDAAILKCKKTCQEQIDTCPANRTDLLSMYKENMKYIDEIAPKQMSEDEVKEFVSTELIELSQVATEPISSKMKGLVMKNIMPKLKGKADGKLINKVVMELLNGQN